MRMFTFSAEDRQELADDRYHHPDRGPAKMEVLWLKSHGLSYDDIATSADVSRRSVQRYLDEYLEGGLSRLRRCPGDPPQRALVEHENSLEEYFLAHPPHSTKQARASIEQRTGVRRGLSQVRHFLKDGSGWAGARSGPSPSRQEDHRGACRGGGHLRGGAAGATAGAGPAGPVAGLLRGRRHFVFAPFLGCVWCVARLFVRAASGRKRYNVLGALDAVTHRLIRVTNHDYINAESVCGLLRAVAEASAGLPITLVLDNARCRKCALVQALAASLGIELLYLPSYSPNLNLIERLWR